MTEQQKNLEKSIKELLLSKRLIINFGDGFDGRENAKKSTCSINEHLMKVTLNLQPVTNSDYSDWADAIGLAYEKLDELDEIIEYKKQNPSFEQRIRALVVLND